MLVKVNYNVIILFVCVVICAAGDIAANFSTAHKPAGWCSRPQRDTILSQSSATIPMQV